MSDKELYDRYLRLLHHPQGYLNDKELKEKKRFERELNNLWSCKIGDPP